MNRLKVDVICNDGSPLGVVSDDVYGRNGRVGVGGAELALLTLCEAWSKVHDVRLFNDPKGRNTEFEQCNLTDFHPKEERDILIIFRSPNKRIKGAKGKKVWWSTDQFTVGNFHDFSEQVDKIVTISPFHAQYFNATYGIKDTTTIDLPVRLWDYEKPVEKVKNRLIFCSVPDRGLQILAKAFQGIQQQVPDASLVITSDYRLWGSPTAGNEQHMARFFGLGGVRFAGAIPREQMVLEQQQAEIQAYPCTYDELFCYSVAECSVAGALPITSTTGAIATTNMGVLVEGDVRSDQWRKRFVEKVVFSLQNPRATELVRADTVSKAKERFSLETVLPQWEKVFNG